MQCYGISCSTSFWQDETQRHAVFPGLCLYLYALLETSEPDSDLLLSCYRRRLLVRHNSVMERLREEVHTIVGYGKHPTREQIRKMPYLT